MTNKRDNDLPPMYREELDPSTVNFSIINPPKGIIEELKRMDDLPRIDWYKSQIRKRNQNRKEEIDFGKE